MSTSDLFINATEFTPDTDVSYGKPKANSRGGKSIPIYNSATGQSLQLSIPLLLTWGVNTRENENGQRSYDFSLQFPSPGYGNTRTDACLDAMVQLESKLCSDAMANSRDWFNKPTLSPDQVSVLFNPMLYRPRDKETGELRDDAGPTLRVKVDCWDGEFGQELYGVEGNLLYGPGKGLSTTPVELISKRSHIACIIRCGGVYFVNGKFGITWRLVQGVVKTRATITGHCHIKLDADEVATLEAQRESDDDEAEQSAENEVSEQQEELKAATAVQAPKKKRVVRKAKRTAS